jgi:hypothetical protein
MPPNGSLSSQAAIPRSSHKVFLRATRFQVPWLVLFVVLTVIPVHGTCYYMWIIGYVSAATHGIQWVHVRLACKTLRAVLGRRIVLTY